MIYRCNICKTIIKPDENRFRAMKQTCACGLRWADNDYRNPNWVAVNEDGLTADEAIIKWEADQRIEMTVDLGRYHVFEMSTDDFLNKWSPKWANY